MPYERVDSLFDFSIIETDQPSVIISIGTAVQFYFFLNSTDEIEPSTHLVHHHKNFSFFLYVTQIETGYFANVGTYLGNIASMQRQEKKECLGHDGSYFCVSYQLKFQSMLSPSQGESCLSLSFSIAETENSVAITVINVTD